MNRKSKEDDNYRLLQGSKREEETVPGDSTDHPVAARSLEKYSMGR